MANTVEQLRRWGVGLRSYSEPWLDTSGASPVADLTLNILASFAQFEKALIAERVCAGMARAKREGKHVGRPQKVNGEWEQMVAVYVRKGENNERILSFNPRRGLPQRELLAHRFGIDGNMALKIVPRCAPSGTFAEKLYAGQKDLSDWLGQHG